MSVATIIVVFSLQAPSNQTTRTSSNSIIAERRLELELTNKVLDDLIKGHVEIGKNASLTIGLINRNKMHPSENPPVFHVSGHIHDNKNSTLEALRADGWNFDEETLNLYKWT